MPVPHPALNIQARATAARREVGARNLRAVAASAGTDSGQATVAEALAGDLAALVQAGLIVPIKQGGAIRYAVACDPERSPA